MTVEAVKCPCLSTPPSCCRPRPAAGTVPIPLIVLMAAGLVCQLKRVCYRHNYCHKTCVQMCSVLQRVLAVKLRARASLILGCAPLKLMPWTGFPATILTRARLMTSVLVVSAQAPCHAKNIQSPTQIALNRTVARALLENSATTHAMSAGRATAVPETLADRCNACAQGSLRRRHALEQFARTDGCMTARTGASYNQNHYQAPNLSPSHT